MTTFCHPFLPVTFPPSLFYMSPWGEAEGSPEEILPLRLSSGSEWQARGLRRNYLIKKPVWWKKGILRWRLLGKGWDSSLRWRSVQNDAFSVTLFYLLLFSCPFFYMSPWGEAEGSPEEILRLRLRMTKKGSDDVLSRSPELMRRGSEGSVKGLRRDDKITRKEISIGNFREIVVVYIIFSCYN